MTKDQVTSSLRVDDYGELYYLNRGYGIKATGKIRYITTDGDIVFSHNDYPKKMLIRPEHILDWTPKEILPVPTDYRGHKVFFEDGRWINDEGKEIDFKR